MIVVEYCLLRLIGVEVVGWCLWGKDGVLVNKGLFGVFGLLD